MKRIALGLALVLPSLLGLQGCAGVPHAASSDWQVDSAQVAAIERAAQRNGVRVIWFRQPMKKTAGG